MKKKLIVTLALFTFTIVVSSDSAAALVAPLSSIPAATTSEPSPSTVKSAIDEFRSLSKKERKTRIKNAKKEIRKYRAERKSGNTDIEPWVLIVLAILLPPLAVYLYEDEINWKFWVSILLTILFWIPGVIFAFLVIFGQV